MIPRCLTGIILAGLLIVSAPAGAAVQITSVSPSVAGPGTTLTVTGGPFRDDVTVYLGENPVRPDSVEGRLLTLTIPTLPPGQYALRVAEGERISGDAFMLRITEPVPRIDALEPSMIQACQGGVPPTIAIEGGGFLPQAQLLLDGAGIPADSVTGAEIMFTPPNLAGGLHQVVVVNPGGSRSLPRGLQVDAAPAIDAVTIGTDNVTSYEVIISGENFLAASNLIVNGKRIPMVGHSLPREDSFRYVDCSTLIYTRHPYSSEPKPTAFQVVNPGGLQTPVHHSEIP